MQQRGNAERQTLEEQILPEVIQPSLMGSEGLLEGAPKVEGDRKALVALSQESETLPSLDGLPTDAQQQRVASISADESQNIESDVDTWTKTSYIYDITQPYGQLLTETTGSSSTAYTYGLERISAANGSLKTQYIYDGRGSVAQTIGHVPNAPTPTVQSYAYTPFGAPITPAASTTGFGYNAELYDAATGMQYLRARVYEPSLMRFSQKDILRGGLVNPLSLNRYAYVRNDPTNMSDPTGREAFPNSNIESSDVKLITTDEAYAINGGKPGVHVPGGGQLYDVLTEETVNIVWGNVPDNYHTDWSPETDADVDTLKKILHPETPPDDPRWEDPKYWSWDARFGILTMSDGTNAAVGFHLKPHLAIVGDAKLTTLKDAGTDKTGPLGGHMCMYFIDSWGTLNGKMKPQYNNGAQQAYNISQMLNTVSAIASSVATTIAKVGVMLGAGKAVKK